MEIVGHSNETYLYINGVSTAKEIHLHDNIILTPVLAPFQYGIVSDLLKNDVDFAVAAISERTITSQMHIFASNEEELAC